MMSRGHREGLVFYENAQALHPGFGDSGMWAVSPPQTPFLEHPTKAWNGQPRDGGSSTTPKHFYGLGIRPDLHIPPQR